MIMPGKAVAIIPAKLTSVRLPKKNIRLLSGRPLFYYSVRVAQLCKNISEVFVSSESDELLDIAEKFNTKIIKRPEELSRPEVTNFHVLEHLLHLIQEKSLQLPEFIVLLQPTHPFRFPHEIDLALDVLVKEPSFDGMLAVSPIADCETNPVYKNTGSFYIFRTQQLLKNKTLLSNKMLNFVLSYPELEVDIDEAEHFEWAKTMFKQYDELFHIELKKKGYQE